MSAYENLLIDAEEDGLFVKEALLQSGDGRCKGNRIAIRKDIPTLKKKADVLAEEMGHYHTTVGDITRMNYNDSSKQERAARLYGYNKRFGLHGIIEAYLHQCQNFHDAAEYLDVSEDTFREGLECYRQIYGPGIMVDNYFIQFEPHLQVYEYFNFN